ncbi:MAG: Asp-tRNA(Asn)/Glu-tRNA(Gln) amidotransferase subunit GatB [Candidatus Zambryskibacteria bacterium]|nr:Asp-tRNA(Asn)/Glu-tRNA(Gln) amidotransferase subunit GatB [Candidatus Zambryskibacteria bacterium]
MSYKATIGLEIHAELKTKSKMFCPCANEPIESSTEIGSKNAPNQHVCPICMGHPGTLPVVNKAAVKKVLSVGLALGSTLADFTEFDRKNYFYPDIPKGYQISQYKYPLVSGGSLAGVGITRIHLEEDTARSSHDGPVGKSLVDFNRAGVPLMELVTEPVIHSAEEAMKFAQELQILLQYMDISDANMEKGQMRVEVNISISDTETFGTKVEVKNINSFKAAGKAIECEFARQSALLDTGEKVKQETRGWDENKQITFSQRSKENSDDYRYFPDPDIPKFKLSELPEFSAEELRKNIPETPTQKRERYAKDYGLKPEDVENYIFNRELGGFFEEVAGLLGTNDAEAIKLASNYISSDLTGLAKASNLPFPEAFGHLEPQSIADLIHMIKKGQISSRGAKDILKIIHEKGGKPEEIAQKEGFIQKSDPEELKKIIQEIMDANPAVVADYKSGKESVFQFFIGQAMKITKGAGNPEMIKQITLELLK